MVVVTLGAKMGGPRRPLHRTYFLHQTFPYCCLMPASSDVHRTSCTASCNLAEGTVRVSPSLSLSAVFLAAPRSGNVPPGSVEADDRARAGAGSLPSSLARRRGVTSVNVESLSPHEFDSSGCDSPGCPAYESDPPWEEIRASVPESMLQRVIFRGFPRQNASHELPHPSTPGDLHRNLVHAITAYPPAHLSQVLTHHAAHPGLHTTASFNLLIRYAIRVASFGKVSELLFQMVQEDVPGDLETRALRVRSMVRSGSWGRAWQEEMAQVHECGSQMPLAVWLEFFGTVKRGAILANNYTLDCTPKGRPKSLQLPSAPVTARRLQVMLEHVPAVGPEEWEGMQPHVVHAMVRMLVAQARRTAAMEITKAYFRSLPEKVDEEWRRRCLAIIHLHLTFGRGRKLSEHFAALRTLFALLDMHHSFQPTSTTLFLLLKTLRSARNCGVRADILVHSFEKRWGPDIVDKKVRRRWASLWLKQRRLHRAEAIVGVQNALDTHCAHSPLAEQHADGVEVEEGRGRPLRWLDHHRSRRKGKGRWYWRLLRLRIWRAKVRHSR